LDGPFIALYSISGERLDKVPTSKIDPFDLVKSKCEIFSKEDACNFALIGVIPFEDKLLSPRTYDMAQHLGATIIKEGDIMNRRVDCIKIVARSVKNMVGTLKVSLTIHVYTAVRI
jgi:phosphate acetyltransferase